MFFTFQIAKEDGSTWAIGKIYGGTQDLSAYYLCFVRLKKVDEEWAADDEGKARILFLENRKGAPMQKQLQALFDRCALLVDGDDITFVFDLLVTDAQRAALEEVPY